MSSLVCWNCGEDLTETPRPISRHASCPQCFNELHCCRLCRHFDPKATMTCLEDRADPPLQKENANFCDFFSPRFGAFDNKNADKSDAAKTDLEALFGQTDDPAEEQAQQSEENTEAEDEPLSKEALAKKKLDDLFG